MKLSVISILAFLLLAGCFTSRKTADGDEAIYIERIKEVYPNYTEMDFKQGKMLYENTCNTCHAFKNPANYTSEELKSIVPNMVRKSNQKKGTSLTSLDSDLIYKYMLSITP